MGDQSATIGGTGAGQPPVDITNVGQPVQPQNLTLEQVTGLVAEAEEKAFRRAQGLFDRRFKKVQETQTQLEKTLALMRENGVEVSPDVANIIQQKAFQAALTEPEQAPVTASQPAQAPGTDDQLDPVTEMALGFEKRYGVEVAEDDPEARLIKTDGTPDEYIETYLQAIVAKKQRLQQAPQQPSTAGLRTPTNLVGSGNPAAPERDFKDYRSVLRSGLRG